MFFPAKNLQSQSHSTAERSRWVGVLCVEDIGSHEE